MCYTHARPEQTQSPITHGEFPPFEQAGRDAAALWLQSASLSMGEFRDLRFRSFIAGLSTLDDYTDQRDAFNDGFTRCIAHAIATASRAATAANRRSEGAFGR
jgi:hypothetical protein